MRKRLIISESEARNIRMMYGLINEEDDVRCDEWKEGKFVQGDGVTTPKITITKNPTLIEGLYEGPDQGGCIQRSKFNDQDTPHQLAGITVFYEAAPYLKKLYKSGVYVRPDTKNITMERVLNKKFKISIPLLPTTEDKAVTSINERGGMGHIGDLTEIQNIESDPNNIFVEKQKVIEGDMTETFISFRNIKNFPILSKQSPPSPITIPSTQPKLQSAKNIISINSNSLIELRNKLNEKTANISIDVKSVIPNFNKGSYSISFAPGTTKIKKLSLVFDNVSAQTLDDRMIELDRINNLQRISIGETEGEDGSPRWYALSYVPSE